MSIFSVVTLGGRRVPIARQCVVSGAMWHAMHARTHVDTGHVSIDADLLRNSHPYTHLARYQEHLKVLEQGAVWFKDRVSVSSRG